MGKRRIWPDSGPLAYMRAGPVTAEHLDTVANRLRNTESELCREALAVINVQAAYIVTLENELGQIYEGESKCSVN